MDLFRPIETGLVALFLALLPFSDSGLQATPLSFLGASPSVLPLIALLALGFIRDGGRLPVSRTALAIALFGWASGFVALARYGFISHGENLVFKGVKVFIMVALLYFSFTALRRSASRFRSPHLPMVVFLLIAFSWLVNDAIGLTEANALFHFSPNHNLRPRGWSLESSTYGVFVVVTGLVAIIRLRGRLAKWMMLGGMIALLLVAQSKGGIASFFFAATFASLQGWKRRPILTGVTLTVLAAGFAILLPTWLARMSADIEEYSSLATRATLMVSGLLIAIHNPLGVGYMGFLPALKGAIPLATSFLASLSPVPLNFQEVDGYRYAATSTAIANKSTFFEFATFFGILAVPIFLLAARRGVALVNGDFFRRTLLWFMILASVGYFNSLGYYVFGYGYAFGLAALQRNRVEGDEHI